MHKDVSPLIWNLRVPEENPTQSEQLQLFWSTLVLFKNKLYGDASNLKDIAAFISNIQIDV